MYKIPSLEKVSKVVIDAAVIDGESEPLLMFENVEASTNKAAAED
jgi:ATP-dependent Clp protease ATP-binding subunit ClpX